MANINDIATAASYRGDPNLGGGNFGVIQLDTRPLDNLAAYTYKYNQQMYEDKQKKIEDQAKELSDLTAYDLNSAIPKDREYLQKKWDSVYSYVKDNIAAGKNVMDFQNNREGWLEYQKRKADLMNDIGGAKTRSTLYAVRQKEVDDNTDPDVKAYLKKSLDEEADATDIRTPLKHTNQFDLAPIAVNAANRKEIQVTDIGANMIGTRTYDLPDMDNVANQAVAVMSGLKQFQMDENSLAFQALTPEAQQQYRQQNKAIQASGKLEPIESAKNFNDAITSLKNSGKYTNEDGTLNMDALIGSGNDLVAGVAEQVKLYNAKMDQMTHLINNGAFKDNLGRDLHFGPTATGGLNPSSYSKINLDDGLSGTELLKIRILAKSAAEKAQTKVQVTKLGLEQHKADVEEWYKKAQVGIQKQRADAYVKHLALATHQLKTEQDQDAFLETLWNRNLLDQKNLFHLGKSGNLLPEKMRIDNSNSLPIYTIQNGKPTQLKPIGGEPIYDRYEYDKVNKIQVPSRGARIVGYKGGYYETQYTYSGSDGSVNVLDPASIQESYLQFKGKHPEYKKDLTGYLKDNIANGVYDVRLKGDNGASDRQLSTAAQRLISNAGTKKGQVGVFDDSGEYDPTGGTSESTTTENIDTSDQNQKEQQ